MGNSDFTVAVTATEKMRNSRISHFDSVRKEAVKLFEYSFEKTAKEKALCIEKAIAFYDQKDAYSKADFQKDFYKRILPFLDSRAFCKFCEMRGFDAYTAATHLVFWNCKTKLKNLILNRDYKVFDSYAEWNEAIFEEKALQSHFVGTSSTEAGE